MGAGKGESGESGKRTERAESGREGAAVKFWLSHGPFGFAFG